jgi:hypothetical protein
MFSGGMFTLRAKPREFHQQIRVACYSFEVLKHIHHYNEGLFTPSLCTPQHEPYLWAASQVTRRGLTY